MIGQAVYSCSFLEASIWSLASWWHSQLPKKEELVMEELLTH